MMDKVFSTVTSFLTGLGSLLMAFLPLTILWQVLTGNTVFGMDVIANLTSLVTGIGEGGFVGLVVLILVVSFFTDKK
jgi:hypothetical protein|tara:strand:+ start:204 stop:434 length:231 start_codon:yes stop_codon:yes gene_type:complete